jgi:hypothetical protein
MREVGDALERYREEWGQRSLREVPGGSANEKMVKALLAEVDDWKEKLQRRRLGPPSSWSSGEVTLQCAGAGSLPSRRYAPRAPS